MYVRLNLQLLNLFFRSLACSVVLLAKLLHVYIHGY